MNVLKGRDKAEYMKFRVRQIVNHILNDRPASYSTLTLDFEIRKALQEALTKEFVLSEWDGTRLRLSYVPEE
jgi:hypothetical protein